MSKDMDFDRDYLTELLAIVERRRYNLTIRAMMYSWWSITVEPECGGGQLASHHSEDLAHAALEVLEKLPPEN